MGLDMYLYAEKTMVPNEALTALLNLNSNLPEPMEPDEDGSVYLPRWDHLGPEAKAMTDAILEAAGLLTLAGEESNSGSFTVNPDGTVTVAIMGTYWRKANAIHQWFVDKVQGGVDECEPNEATMDDLMLLAAECDAALSHYRKGRTDEAGRILPPQSGFFFGGTDIDEWWADSMKWTANELRRLVAEAKAIGGVRFVYQSSW